MNRSVLKNWKFKRVALRSRVLVCLSITLIIFAASCGFGGKSPSLVRESLPDHWTLPADAAFVSKTWRALIYRDRPTPDVIQSHVGKSRYEVVQDLMSHPGSVKQTIDFGLYFHGRAGNLSSQSGGSSGFEWKGVGSGAIEILERNPMTAALRAAIATAQVVSADKPKLQAHFLDLLDLRAPNYAVLPTPPASFDSLNLPLREGIDRASYEAAADLDKRRMITGSFISNLTHMLSAGSLNWSRYCSGGIEIFRVYVFGAGIPLDYLRAQSSEIYEAYSELYNQCFDKRDSEQDLSSEDVQIISNMRDLAKDFEDKWPRLPFRSAEQKSWYHGLIDSDELPFKGTSDEVALLTTDLLGFFQDNQNSSTNSNRRRAAKILKTYFCDDVEPLNIAAPQLGAESHAGEDAHASEPSCQACHYRLDPMAGFFKYHGLIGIDLIRDPEFGGFKSLIENALGVTLTQPGETFIFDDQATLKGSDVSDYLDQWRAPQGQTAFVRSPSDTRLNDVGDDLQDLFEIINRAPEVKRCLTQKMVDYYLGAEQSVPGRWIETLSRKWNVPSADSASVYVQIVQEIVLSKTFLIEDPELGVCYEETQSQAQSAIPCEIEYLFEKNCTQCHNSRALSGGLSLEDAELGPDGLTIFRHLDRATGLRLSRAESFDRVLESLATQDSSLRMPLMKHMDPLDRERLIRWATDERSRTTGE